MELQHLLETSSRDHTHLCPRQILGVRMGLAGMSALGFDAPPGRNRLLIILETDGCFADGITAATACKMGHRTLRLEDYGKVAATFVDTHTGRAIRVAPVIDIRQRAAAHVPEEPRHYFAQLTAYQNMPDEEMFTVQEVALNITIANIVSRPGMRVNCDMCGEEVVNEREVRQQGLTLCRACAGSAYYQLPVSLLLLEKTTA